MERQEVDEQWAPGPASASASTSVAADGQSDSKSTAPHKKYSGSVYDFALELGWRMDAVGQAGRWIMASRTRKEP